MRNPGSRPPGKSERAIQRIVQRAARNGHANLARVTGTSLDQRAELDARPCRPCYAEEPHSAGRTGAQVSAVQARKKMPPQEAEVSDAASCLDLRPPDSVEHTSDLQGLTALKSAWRGIDPLHAGD